MVFRTLLMVCLFSSTANAAVVFTPSWFYMTYDTEQGATTTESELSIYNFKLGAVQGSGLYFGAVYDMEDITEDQRTSMGAGIGYVKGGWNFHLTYFLKSELEVGNTEYSGYGYNFEIGYLFGLGSWSLGPSLTYRYFSYDDIDGADLDPEYENTRLLPYVTFQFQF